MDSPDTACITTCKVLSGELPVLLVVHDEDGGWQFLCGTTNDTADGRIIGFQEALTIDPDLRQVIDLPVGGRAWRESATPPWIRD